MREAKPGECVNSSECHCGFPHTFGRTNSADEIRAKLDAINAPPSTCAKCGTRTGTQEVMIMQEHPAGTVMWCDECLKKPTWTTTPPTEPGWYWVRDDKNTLCPVKMVNDVECIFGVILFPAKDMKVEWWPVRIEEPPR